MSNTSNDLGALIAEQVVYPVLLQIAGGVAVEQESDDTCSDVTSANDEATMQWRDTLLQMCHKTVSIVYNKHYDVVIRTLPALIKRFRHHKTKKWTAVSPWNVSRTFDSAQQSAQELLPSLETCTFDFFRATSETKPIVRIEHGFVCITTPERALQLESDGWLPCPECAEWLKGVKGLRWHCLQQHQQDFHITLQQSSLENELALVVYQENRTPLNHLFFAINNTTSDSKTTNKKIKLNEQSEYPWEYAKEGNLHKLQHYLINNPQFHPESARDRNGATILMWAAGSGQLEMVRYLVEEIKCCVQQAQHGRRSFAGRTALHWAARNGHMELVQYLLQQGADIYAETEDGTTAFHWTAWQGHVDILQLLIQSTDDLKRLVQHSNSYGCNAALWAAQGAAGVGMFRLLQDLKCPLNVVNYAQHGVLHKAAQRGNRDVCVWFVNFVMFHESEWRLIGPDEDGCLPSDIAGMQGFEELAIYLMDQEEVYAFRLMDLGIDYPDWFSRGFVPCRSRICEPYAGIARLLALQQKERVKEAKATNR
ncbi:hypothetical protein FisN_8Hh005 [Fistulifera solaris]|uniref:Uncharacterized protein n=1 Tax=Fistulifera solaris TaxID=1519565 RepID=A0A1Z5JJQ5_FISSO|nr:hypothetical protein FisN_8Hh005 [Fistulifera solaris]|eukprot:GAX14156.1 hypothetical protein FisN_8Hh005 [Fistulifera solaris]